LREGGIENPGALTRRAPRKFLFAGAQNWQSGGTSYSKTPVGAVSNTDEPYEQGNNDVSTYFGLWASGKNFGMCAWNSIVLFPNNPTPFQAIGDPFVTR
jgi:hypothetical protein